MSRSCGNIGSEYTANNGEALIVSWFIRSFNHTRETKGNTVGSRRKKRELVFKTSLKMTQKQKNALIGMILGDAYLQMTGKNNARIRLEHALAQKDYLIWKVGILANYFQSKVQILDRKHIKWNRVYSYARIQSTSSPEFGKMQKLFYLNSKKVIPKDISSIFKNPLTLAIWFMDDGYYYHRDKMAYIYISNHDKESIDNLLACLKNNFNLLPVLKTKKKGLVLIFSVKETSKLVELIRKYIIPSMSYKVSSETLRSSSSQTRLWA